MHCHFNAVLNAYRRINLTTIRSVPLGDRWDGEATIAGDEIRIVTNGVGPNEGATAPMTIVARRP
jgi:hypothetical protein